MALRDSHATTFWCHPDHATCMCVGDRLWTVPSFPHSLNLIKQKSCKNLWELYESWAWARCYFQYYNDFPHNQANLSLKIISLNKQSNTNNRNTGFYYKLQNLRKVQKITHFGKQLQIASQIFDDVSKYSYAVVWWKTNWLKKEQKISRIIHE